MKNKHQKPKKVYSATNFHQLTRI